MMNNLTINKTAVNATINGAKAVSGAFTHWLVGAGWVKWIIIISVFGGLLLLWTLISLKYDVFEGEMREKILMLFFGGLVISLATILALWLAANNFTPLISVYHLIKRGFGG